MESAAVTENSLPHSPCPADHFDDRQVLAQSTAASNGEEYTDKGAPHCDGHPAFPVAVKIWVPGIPKHVHEEVVIRQWMFPVEYLPPGIAGDLLDFSPAEGRYPVVRLVPARQHRTVEHNFFLLVRPRPIFACWWRHRGVALGLFRRVTATLYFNNPLLDQDPCRTAVR